MLIAGIVIVCCIFIALQWVEGINYMKEHHPDYKGDDFL